MRLDDKTVLYPSNMSSSPYGQKEVRALVNYTVDKNNATEGNIFVTVNRLDSIRTKYPAVSLGEADDETFGNDPAETAADWVTVAEDGYLTLRFRTLWGSTTTPHYISLLTGVNPDDPFELELRHDAKGDVNGVWKDALIAFNLNLLPALQRRDRENQTLRGTRLPARRRLNSTSASVPTSTRTRPRHSFRLQICGKSA